MASTVYFCLAEDQAISCLYAVLLVAGQAPEVTSQISHTIIMHNVMQITFAQYI